MGNKILSAIVVAVLNWVKDYLEGKYSDIKLDNKAIQKLKEVYSTIEQQKAEAMEIIEKPIDPTLPQEEREKLREKAFDDFFNKLG